MHPPLYPFRVLPNGATISDQPKRGQQSLRNSAAAKAHWHVGYSEALCIRKSSLRVTGAYQIVAADGETAKVGGFLLQDGFRQGARFDYVTRNPQFHSERPWSNAIGMTRTFSAQGANAAAAIALFEGAQDSEGGQHEA